MTENPDVRRASDAALDRLERRPIPRGVLAERLVGLGHAAAAVETALDRLVELGLLSDTRYAEAVAREVLRGGPAGTALLEQRMIGRGIDGDVSARVAAAMTGLRPVEAALELAQAHLRRHRRVGREIDPATVRGVLRRLASRGFDEDVALEVAERLGLADIEEQTPEEKEFMS